jgi:hypothetical protein
MTKVETEPWASGIKERCGRASARRRREGTAVCGGVALLLALRRREVRQKEARRAKQDTAAGFGGLRVRRGPPDRQLLTVVGAWRPRGDGPLLWSERDAGASMGKEMGQLRPVGRKRGARPNKGKKGIFFFFFKETQQISIFEQPKIIFSIWCKKKSCLEFCDLQLCQKKQSQNPNRFWTRDLKSIFKSKLYFWRLFLKAKFAKTLNINFAPNCTLIISKWFK